MLHEKPRLACIHKLQKSEVISHTAGDSAEAFLSSCIPDLQLNPFVVQHDFLDFEVNPAPDIPTGNSCMTAKLHRQDSCATSFHTGKKDLPWTYPIVVIKLDVKESSENLSSKQLLPTPVTAGTC